jgi:hypothetical protein
MEVIRVLKRDIGAQFRVSRNLKERATVRVLRAFWAFVYLCKAFRCGLSAMWEQQLGSQVVWNGRKCVVSNWAGRPFVTLCGNGWYQENCPREEVTNVINARELWHRFTFGVSFYLSSWHGIDVNKRIYK